jgi:hypothetical protein
MSVLVGVGTGCAAGRPSSEVKFSYDAGSVDIVELILMFGGGLKSSFESFNF